MHMKGLYKLFPIILRDQFVLKRYNGFCNIATDSDSFINRYVNDLKYLLLFPVYRLPDDLCFNYIHETMVA